MRKVIWLQTLQYFGKWGNYFSQLLNIHGVNDVRQIELHTAEPLEPEPSAFEVELAIKKLKSHNHQVLIKSQQNLLRQEVGQFALRSKLIIFIWNKEKLPEEW